MRMIKIISRSESAVLLLRTVTHSPQTLFTIMSLIFFARARVLRRGVRAWGRRRGAGRRHARDARANGEHQIGTQGYMVRSLARLR